MFQLLFPDGTLTPLYGSPGGEQHTVAQLRQATAQGPHTDGAFRVLEASASGVFFRPLTPEEERAAGLSGENITPDYATQGAS